MGTDFAHIMGKGGERVPACGSRMVWGGLSGGLILVGIILIIVAGSLGGCDCVFDCTTISDAVSKIGSGCTEADVGPGCELKTCDANGASGRKVEGQELSAWIAELAVGIILIVVGLIFSCGACLMCCWGKDVEDAPAENVQNVVQKATEAPKEEAPKEEAPKEEAPKVEGQM